MPIYTAGNHSGDVYLNGIKIENVIRADTTRGELVKYVSDELGNLIVDFLGQEFKKEKLYGKVEFIPYGEV